METTIENFDSSLSKSRILFSKIVFKEDRGSGRIRIFFEDGNLFEIDISDVDFNSHGYTIKN
jgi:hypothetical protein